MANVGDLSVQLKADDQASKKIQNASLNMKQSFGTIQKGALLASAAIIGAFGASVKSFLDTGDELHKLSQRTGIAVRSLEALGHFAELSGQDIKLFEVLSKFLTKQMVSLSEGAVVQTEAFNKLGFSFEKLAAMSKETRMIELIAALADIEDLTRRDVIGFDIFGGQLIKVQNLIGTFTGDEMKEFIEGLKEESTWTQDAADKAANFNDTIAIMQRALGGVAMELAEGHVPAMQRAATRTLQFIQNNREAIAQSASMALTFAKVVLVLKSLGFMINTFVRPAYKGLIALKIIMTKQIIILGRTMSIWKGITFATSKAMLAFSMVLKGLRLAVAGVRLAIMLTYTTALLPLLPFLAGLAALVAVVVSAWLSLSKSFRGDVVNAFKAVWDKVKSLGDKLGWLKTKWKEFIDLINPFKNKIKDVAQSVKDALIPQFDTATNLTQDMTNALIDQAEVLEGHALMARKTEFIFEELTTEQAKAIDSTKKQTEAVIDLGNAFAGLNTITSGAPQESMGQIMAKFPSLHSADAQNALMLAVAENLSEEGAGAKVLKKMKDLGTFGVTGGMSGKTHNININAMTGSQLTKTLTEAGNLGYDSFQN